MAFTVAGTLDGLVRRVTWDDGELDGDDDAIARAQELVAEGATVWATPTGPHYTAALDDAEAALVTLVNVFDGNGETFVTGDPPDVPDVELPPGAVG